MFVVFEGIDGAGKTTQIGFLEERLRGMGLSPLVVHEPGGTPLGDEISRLVKHRREIALTAHAELLLFLASRAQLVTDVMRPALAQGRVVLCDRFTASTLAYQGFGRGLDVEEVGKLTDFVSGGLVPDMTVLLNVPVTVGLQRKSAKGVLTEDMLQLSMFERAEYDRFHDEQAAFHERVRGGYLRLAAEAQGQAGRGRWVVIDGTPGPAAVSKKVWAELEQLLRPVV